MISLRQVRKFLLTISLVVLISVATTFTAKTVGAATSSTLSNQPHVQIAWGFGKAKAVAKDIEGKTQEAIGNVTGDPKDQVMGKAKQVESQVRNAAENAKDSMGLQGRTKAVTKNVEGKVQEAIGNITGNAKDQAMGKAKQVESQVLNAAEDVKAKGRDLLK
ncbi:CsbD family protein [Tumidithrix elongata RA019]|uniref:CsbD family protein n=1 Tax=Tumidithrix elongata BACA0141 TaxID=2716417 RepID=A0AAW9Q5V8_9CYAN|nr:CsbD family protein [Tumidithrix elongata RA019]